MIADERNAATDRFGQAGVSLGVVRLSMSLSPGSESPQMWDAYVMRAQTSL